MTNRSSHLTSILLALGVALGAATAPACKQRGDGKQHLPPATGSGAAPLPQLPVFGTGAAGSAATPTEGRATGTLYPIAEAQLAPNASGVISKILVDEGDLVKKNQVVVQLDARDASLRLQQARASLEGARVSLRGTQVEYDRTKALFEQNAIQKAIWDQVQTRYDGAKVAVQQAEVSVSMAAKSLADTTLRSPLDGVVTTKLKSVGEMATMMPPTVVLVVQDQSTLELRFRLPERELARIEVGKTVGTRIEAAGGATRTAKIVRVNPTIDARTRTLEVVAVMDNADRALRPGLLVEVDFRGSQTAGTPTPPTPPTPPTKTPKSVAGDPGAPR